MAQKPNRGDMIIPFLKVWIWGALIVWTLLMWRWTWTQKVLGYIKTPIPNPERPWYIRPEEEWVEHEPTIFEALFFSFAWPLHLTAFVGALFTLVLMKIFDG